MHNVFLSPLCWGGRQEAGGVSEQKYVLRAAGEKKWVKTKRFLVAECSFYNITNKTVFTTKAICVIGCKISKGCKFSFNHCYLTFPPAVLGDSRLKGRALPALSRVSLCLLLWFLSRPRKTSCCWNKECWWKILCLVLTQEATVSLRAFPLNYVQETGLSSNCILPSCCVSVSSTCMPWWTCRGG